jgi:hypothetical protein
MAQFCVMCGQVTNCTENCKQCIEEEEGQCIEETKTQENSKSGSQH